jgi:hypothetical protein
MELPPYESWIDERLGALVEEAETLRFGIDAGDSLTFSGVYERLLSVRQRQDRIEGIMASLTRVASDIDQGVADRKAALEDKWNSEATKSKVGFQWGDAAPRERYARYSLQTVKEQVELRRAEKLQRQVRTALTLVKMFHEGLEGIRWTLNTILKGMTVDTKVERR